MEKNQRAIAVPKTAEEKQKMLFGGIPRGAFRKILRGIERDVDIPQWQVPLPPRAPNGGFVERPC